MPTDLTEAQLRRAENRRRLHGEVERKKQAEGFQNGAEALPALRAGRLPAGESRLPLLTLNRKDAAGHDGLVLLGV
jgi:hypothetical protein